MGIRWGMIRPMSVDHLFPDSYDGELAITLEVLRSPLVHPQEFLWKLCWCVGEDPKSHTHIYRQLRLYVCPLPDGSVLCTNWGALTKARDASSNYAARIHVANMTLAQRRFLEGIANRTPVLHPTIPNVWRRPRDWIQSVLWGAVHSGIMTQAAYNAAVTAGLSVS